MIPLIIILSVLLLLGLLLLLPVSVYLKFEDDFFLKIKIGGIKVYEVKPDKDDDKSDTESDREEKKQDEKFFEKLKKKHGFSDAVQEIFTFLRDAINGVKKNIKHISLSGLCLNIKVASEDAALTAIEYGAVCSTVYPVLSLLKSVSDIKYKKINLYTDFNSDKPKFDFSVIIKAKIIFLLIMAFGVFKEYNKFKTRNEL